MAVISSFSSDGEPSLTATTYVGWWQWPHNDTGHFPRHPMDASHPVPWRWAWPLCLSARCLIFLCCFTPQLCPKAKGPETAERRGKQGMQPFLSPRFPHNSAADLYTQSCCACTKRPGSIWAHHQVHPCSAGHPPAGFCQLAIAGYSLNHRAP